MVLGMTMSDKYFFLNREVLFQKVNNNYAIYDLFSGDMISLNRDIGTILELTEEGKNIHDVSVLIDKSVEKVVEILKDLENKKLGYFYPTRIHIEKYKLGDPYELRSHTTPVFNKCYIELPGECNLDCSFCGYPTLFQCTTCTKVKGEVDISRMKRFLNRVIQLDCRNLIFHGGDPISSLEQFISIVAYYRKQGYKERISVITNGSQISQNIVNLFLKYKIHPVIPVFLTADLDQEPYLASFSKLAKKYEISFTVTTVFLEDNVIDMSRVKENISEMKPDFNQSAVIYNKPRNPGQHIYPKLLETTRRVNADVYYHMKRHHPCLWSTLSMSITGDIFSCPYLKKEVLGNIEDSYCIDRIFENEAIYDYWDLSLSSIDNCRDCAFQMGCLDCRALEMRITGDLYGKRLCSLPEKTGITG